MRPVPHRVTNVGNEAIRDRLHQALRDAMRARDSVAAAAGYEGPGTASRRTGSARRHAS
jgi:hypothetical protein